MPVHVVECPRQDNCRNNTPTIWWIALLGIAGVLGFSVMAYGSAQDNDMWWLFATGREILEHGIPHMNPFSVWDDQQIVVQQWIPAVMDYIIYDSFGFIGIGMFVLAQTFALAALLLVLSRVCSAGQGMEVAAVLAAIVIGCATSYISIRPQVCSMIAYVLVLIVMEGYRKNNDWKRLVWLPVIMVAHMNFHMSLAMFDVVIVAAYLLPNLRYGALRGKFSLDYNRIRILFAIAAMLLASLANPYGIDGVLYIVNSIDAAGYGNYISEMGTIAPYNRYYGRCMMAMVVIGGIAIGRFGLRNLNLGLCALFLLTCVMSIQHVRNVWLVSIFAYALFMSSCGYKTISPRTSNIVLRDDALKIIIASFACSLVLVLGIAHLTGDLVKEREDGMSTPIVAADYMDEKAQEGDVSVFTHFNAGGYLEWRGYKVSMDARPELWNDAITKNGEDRYYDYIDMSKDDMEPSDYMRGKTFDYMIVNTDTALYQYLLTSIDYIQVTDGNGYVLLQHR